MMAILFVFQKLVQTLIPKILVVIRLLVQSNEVRL